MKFIETGKFTRSLKEFYLIGDLVCLNLAFLLSFILRFRINVGLNILSLHLILLIITNIAWIIIGVSLRIYNIKSISDRQKTYFDMLKGIFFLFLVIASVVFLLKIDIISRLMIAAFILLSILLLSTWRLVFYEYTRRHKKTQYTIKYVIVGAGRIGQQLHHAFERQPSLGYEFCGYFDDSSDAVKKGMLVNGRLKDIYEYTVRNRVDEIFLALPDIDTAFTRELISYAENNLIKIKIVPDFRKFFARSVNVEFFDNIPLISMRKEPLSRLTNRMVKRIFDIFFSSIVIITILSWLTPIIGLIIKLESRGPIFFRQERNGENNCVFKCIKFRSMKVNKMSNEKQASKNDARITRFGQFLRKSSLDELPQFFNVFIGDMSVVGPRPHMIKHTQEYSQLIDKYMLRQNVKPGITGWAQVSGYRGETKNPELMRLRVIHDVWYMENWDFLLDIKIILLTVFNVLKGEENAG
jgi:Undecaprenyl-phosphate glucose phosphotransferase